MYASRAPRDRSEMSRSTIAGRFSRFIERPTLRRYLAVRELIVADTRFDPYAEDLERIQAWFAADDFAAAIDGCEACQPLWCLSPRLHFFRGVSAAELGQRRLADEERSVMQACLQGLVATGEGSVDKPFRVTYLSDEYDLLRSLGSDVRSQQLVESDHGCCDVLTCHDGTEYWFDVTDLLSAASRHPAELTALPATRSTLARPSRTF